MFLIPECICCKQVFMVGEQRKRGSGAKTSATNTASASESYWWRRIHKLNTGSRFQEVSGSLNCAEKFSALVSCQRGYGSVAFYAFFSLFFLTFLYVIWKIVSAHSRSVRRPGSSNSTKLNPTTHAPTYHISTAPWFQSDGVFDRFHGKKTPPLNNESTQKNSFPEILISPENEKRSKIASISDMNSPQTKNSLFGNHSPSWTSSERIGNPLYDFHRGVSNTNPPSLGNPGYTNEPYPSVLNSRLPTSPYPSAINFQPRPPMLQDYNNRWFEFEKTLAGSFPNNANSFGKSGEKEIGMLSPYSVNVPFRSSYFLPTNRNMQSRGYYDNVYQRDGYPRDAAGNVQTSPSPLITFFKDRSNNAFKSMNKSKRQGLKRKKVFWGVRKQRRTKGGVPPNSFKDYSRHIEENSKRNLNKNDSRYRLASHHWKSSKQSKRKHLDNLRQNKYFEKRINSKRRSAQTHRYQRRPTSKRMHPQHGKAIGGKHHLAQITHHHHHHRNIQLLFHRKRAKIYRRRDRDHIARYHAEKLRLKVRHKSHPEKTNGGKHYPAQLTHNLHRHIKLLFHGKQAKIYRGRDRNHVARYHGEKLLLKVRHKSHPENFQKRRKKNLKHSKKMRDIHPHRNRDVHIYRKHHIARHKVYNFRLYRQYRKHHSIDKEVRGKWKISHHRVRTCKVIDQFSTRGMVKMTREREKNRFLHTLLICGIVRLRIKRRYHGKKSSVRYAQICRKKWYLTKEIVLVDRKAVRHEIPRYRVRICKSSHVHSNARLSRSGKETKLWNVSALFAHKRAKERRRKRKDDFFRTKLRHKHRSNYRKKKWHKKRRRKGHGKLPARGVNLMRNRKRQKGFSGRGSKPTPHKHKPKVGHLSITELKRLKKKRKKHYKGNEKKSLARNRKKGSKMEGGKVNTVDKFYKKLLKVLKLANIFDKKKPNGSHSEIFNSLKAVLTRGQNKLKQTKQSKKKSKMHRSKSKKRKDPAKKEKESQSTKKKQKNGKDAIQTLLAKLLPTIVKSLHEETKEKSNKALSELKTKPTVKQTTKAPRTTKKNTPTTQTPPTTTLSNKFEDILKNILPLLVEKSHKVKDNSLPQAKHGIKVDSHPTPATSPSTTAANLGLKNLLSKLGIGNLTSDNLRTSANVKDSIDPVTKPTVKPSVLQHTHTRPQISWLNPSSAQPTPTPRGTNAILLNPLVGRWDQSPDLRLSEPISAMKGGTISSSIEENHFASAKLHGSFLQGTGNGLGSYSSTRDSNPYSRRILCFGDSITSGYYNHGHSFHPYSQRLSQLLNSDGRLEYYVKASGKVREMAHGSMARRLPQVLGNSSRFDWVIILGGTNDVAHVKNFGDDDSFMNQLISVWKPRIVRDIEVLHEIAHNYGARTVLLTIPETAYEAWPNFKTLWVMRNKINQDLRKYARESQGNTVLCDLAAKLPRHSLPLQSQNLLWNDHLHLTPYGYDKMADIVYQCLKPYLTK